MAPTTKTVPNVIGVSTNAAHAAIVEQAGFAVGWVKGDKALICTRENPAGEVVDFMRGADSNDPNYQALAWQPGLAMRLEVRTFWRYSGANSGKP